MESKYMTDSKRVKFEITVAAIYWIPKTSRANLYSQDRGHEIEVISEKWRAKKWCEATSCPLVEPRFEPMTSV